MSTYTSADQMAAAMRQAGEAMGKAQAKAVRDASAKLQQAVKAIAPARLSHVGKNGAALGISTKASGDQATGKATGPWGIIEYDTPTHLIGIGRSRTGRRGKARKRAKVTISSGAAVGGILHGAGYAHPVRGPIVHPGTKGKLVFHKGVAAGHPAAVAVLHKTSFEVVKEALG